MTVHVGGMALVEDDRFQNLILIGLTLVMEDVVVEDLVHRMALDLEEECIDSYFVLHWPFVGYLNNEHDTTLH